VLADDVPGAAERGCAPTAVVAVAAELMFEAVVATSKEFGTPALATEFAGNKRIGHGVSFGRGGHRAGLVLAGATRRPPRSPIQRGGRVITDDAHRDGHHGIALPPAYACAHRGARRSDGGARRPGWRGLYAPSVSASATALRTQR
jgi:hypothetical protein